MSLILTKEPDNNSSEIKVISLDDPRISSIHNLPFEELLDKYHYAEALSLVVLSDVARHRQDLAEGKVPPYIHREELERYLALERISLQGTNSLPMSDLRITGCLLELINNSCRKGPRELFIDMGPNYLTITDDVVHSKDELDQLILHLNSVTAIIRGFNQGLNFPTIMREEISLDPIAKTRIINGVYAGGNGIEMCTRVAQELGGYLWFLTAEHDRGFPEYDIAKVLHTLATTDWGEMQFAKTGDRGQQLVITEGLPGFDNQQPGRVVVLFSWSIN